MVFSNIKKIEANRMKYFPIILLIIFGVLFSSTVAYSQNKSDNLKPQWLHKLPKPSNFTFSYKSVEAHSISLEEAREKAVNELFTDEGIKSGVAIISNHTSKEHVSQVWDNGKLTEKITTDLETNTYANSSEIKMYASLIDEYWSQDASGVYQLTRLYAKSELEQKPLYDKIELTTKYYSDPATWGLCFIPGAAQMHKGSYLKGGIIIGGTVAIAAGAIVCNSLRDKNIVKINQSHSADVRKYYNDKANNCVTARNVCLGTLAALYIYNIVDAFVAPGARRIIVHPTATMDGQLGVGASYNF